MSPEPMLRARPCPESMLPRNAAAALKTAAANGWDAHAMISIGWTFEESPRVQRCVAFYARKDGVRLEGFWVGEVDGALGWDRGWRYPDPTPMSWTRLHEELKGNPVKSLTKAAQAKLEEEALVMLAGIKALSPIAWPIKVWAVGNNWRPDPKDGTWKADGDGWCAGMTMENDRGRISCPNPAVPDGVLCAGPCGSTI